MTYNPRMESWQRRRLWRTFVALIVFIGFLLYAWSIRPQRAPGVTRASQRPGEPIASTAPWAITVLENEAYQPALLADIDSARESIDVAMFVIRIDASGRVQQLMDALAAAVKRGVIVRVLLDRSLQGAERHDLFNRAAGARLQEARVGVRFDRPEIELHDKLVVIDGRIVFVGAHNWTPDALGQNHELTLRLESASPVTEATTSFAERWAAGNDPGRIVAGQSPPGAIVVETAE